MDLLPSSEDFSVAGTATISPPPPSSVVLDCKRPSIDRDPMQFSPANAVSSSPSPAPSASSGPSSPVHTEDEKQENESTEKSGFAFDIPGMH